jgi:hypothetical protein
MEVGHAYIWSNVDEVLLDNFEHLALILEEEAVNLTVRVFGRQVELQYTLEEGSLRERITVWATLSLFIQGIANYHDLRTSIIDLYNDARFFGREAIEQFHNITRTSHEDVISQRVTPRDVARLHRIIENTDKLMTELKLGDVQIRYRVTTDLAALCRAYPDDPGLVTLMNALPRHKNPLFPETPAQAIAEDDLLRRRRQELQPQRSRVSSPEMAGRHPFRRRRRYQHTTQF